MDSMIRVYRDIENLKGLAEDMFVFRFCQILLENGMMEPWQVIYGPSRFRILM